MSVVNGTMGLLERTWSPLACGIIWQASDSVVAVIKQHLSRFATARWKLARRLVTFEVFEVLSSIPFGSSKQKSWSIIEDE